MRRFPFSSASPPNGPAPALGRPGRPAPSLTPRVAASLRWCHQVTRRRARNFYYGLKLTPEPRRSALYAVYALMRACDDLVDAPPDSSGREAPSGEAASEPSVREGLARIETFRAAMNQVVGGGEDDPLPEGRLWPAVRYVVRTYRIDPAHLHLMLDGQRDDLTIRRYATFEELYGYCYKVASVVGLVCLAVWGHDGEPGVAKLAEHRGIAFQLTNVLRDLVEDARRGRVYLPREDLARFGVNEDQLRAGQATPNFGAMMRGQIERAREYYERSAALERHLEPDCRATSWAMNEIYRRLLERIAADPRRVLTRRVRLGSPEKLTIAARAVLMRRRRGTGGVRRPSGAG